MPTRGRASPPTVGRLHFLLLALLCAAPDLGAATLKPETVAAWDRYLEWADRTVRSQTSAAQPFLLRRTWSSKEQAEIERDLRAGRVPVRKVKGIVPENTSFKVPDGEIHHWWGSVLVPRAKLSEVLAMLQDYDRHSDRFLEVEKSRLISRKGDTYTFYFRLRRSKAPMTIFYNTEQSCVYMLHGPKRASSRSEATKIAELESPGTPEEKEKSHDDDWGFLWRLVSWWRFEETEEGVVIELESASLSRDVPWLLRLIPGAMGYIESVPRESIENTLQSIRRHAPSSGAGR